MSIAEFRTISGGIELGTAGFRLSGDNMGFCSRILNKTAGSAPVRLESLTYILPAADTAQENVQQSPVVVNLLMQLRAFYDQSNTFLRSNTALEVQLTSQLRQVLARSTGTVRAQAREIERAIRGSLLQDGELRRSLARLEQEVKKNENNRIGPRLTDGRQMFGTLPRGYRERQAQRAQALSGAFDAAREVHKAAAAPPARLELVQQRPFAEQSGSPTLAAPTKAFSRPTAAPQKVQEERAADIAHPAARQTDDRTAKRKTRAGRGGQQNTAALPAGTKPQAQPGQSPARAGADLPREWASSGQRSVRAGGKAAAASEKAIPESAAPERTEPLAQKRRKGNQTVLPADTKQTAGMEPSPDKIGTALPQEKSPPAQRPIQNDGKSAAEPAGEIFLAVERGTRLTSGQRNGLSAGTLPAAGQWLDAAGRQSMLGGWPQFAVLHPLWTRTLLPGVQAGVLAGMPALQAARYIAPLVYGGPFADRDIPAAERDAQGRVTRIFRQGREDQLPQRFEQRFDKRPLLSTVFWPLAASADRPGGKQNVVWLGGMRVAGPEGPTVHAESARHSASLVDWRTQAGVSGVKRAQAGHGVRPSGMDAFQRGRPASDANSLSQGRRIYPAAQAVLHRGEVHFISGSGRERGWPFAQYAVRRPAASGVEGQARQERNALAGGQHPAAANGFADATDIQAFVRDIRTNRRIPWIQPIHLTTSPAAARPFRPALDRLMYIQPFGPHSGGHAPADTDNAVAAAGVRAVQSTSPVVPFAAEQTVQGAGVRRGQRQSAGTYQAGALPVIHRSSVGAPQATDAAWPTPGSPGRAFGRRITLRQTAAMRQVFAHGRARREHTEQTSESAYAAADANWQSVWPASVPDQPVWPLALPGGREHGLKPVLQALPGGLSRAGHLNAQSPLGASFRINGLRTAWMTHHLLRRPQRPAGDRQDAGREEFVYFAQPPEEVQPLPAAPAARVGGETERHMVYRAPAPQSAAQAGTEQTGEAALRQQVTEWPQPPNAAFPVPEVHAPAQNAAAAPELTREQETRITARVLDEINYNRLTEELLLRVERRLRAERRKFGL